VYMQPQPPLRPVLPRRVVSARNPFASKVRAPRAAK
jgi:hypothetical protein